MKKLFTVFALMLSLSAQAATPSLKDNMKQLGKLFKQITNTVGDRGQNAQNSINAKEMGKLLTTVREQIPDSILALPPGSRPAAIADYQKIIDKELAAALGLQDAFVKGDNTAAANFVNTMNLDKKDGHNKYKKD